ncbi:hypothetical protein [Candidatus Chromulinivorax destructor]|uniref:Uncharacterized protein n=1 Tax=Candidatus Chromulinivorax destructor TaxID=2066483 RepID=A0A345ZBE8_9BACT|nr:hypothetical protein [Candidatus Chromulinivorax destructor]AXK60615.1 hypothetical protein C0J27_02555 [Candidatus Chromulinivorax destructor]
MKYLRQIGMLMLMFILGAAGYMAAQRYCAHQEDVKVQLLDNMFGGDRSDSDHNHRRRNASYNEGYQDGLHDGQKNCHRDRS